MLDYHQTVLGFEDIKKYLKYAYPMLLVDRVVDIEKWSKIVTIKNVTGNEAAVAAHFPHYSVNPGVMTLESSFQSAALLGFLGNEEEQWLDLETDKLVVLLRSVSDVAFRLPVLPGESMVNQVEITQMKISETSLVGKLKFNTITTSGKEIMRGKAVAVLTSSE